MDTLKIAGAQSQALVEELRKPAGCIPAPAAGIRALEDWELALAGGGDVAPEWPDQPGP
jgi:hypothetical protein